MKLCLLQFYTRLETGSIRVHRAIQGLRLFLIFTFLFIVLATLLECRPLSMYGNLSIYLPIYLGSLLRLALDYG